MDKHLLSKTDQEYLATLRREVSYKHWSPAECRVLELCIKWFLELHEANSGDTPPA